MVARRSSAPSRPTLPAVDQSGIIVPRLNKDPIWSLRPWPVEVDVAGQRFEIPALCATDWLCYLMQPQPDLDSLITDLTPGLEDLVYESDDLDVEGLYELFLEIISVVSARPWWVSLRLISVARDSWDVLGPKLIERRADPNTLSLAAWLDVLLVVVLDSMDRKDTTMFTMKLEATPDWGREKPQELEMDRGSFLSLAG